MGALYPVRFEPIFKEMMWGGNRLAFSSRALPFEHTGESWDISCREKEMGVVANGRHRGKTFIEYINTDKNKILGSAHAAAGDFDFPLLIKFIDANDFLSVQVHPDDAYARKADSYPFGKNEMWYVADAPEGSYLIIGLKDGVTKNEFKNALESGRGVGDMLNRLYVKSGDAVDIPAGLVHAVGKGVLIAEIQQNSDLTYRVYDYGRAGLDGKPRALHIEKALDVIDFEQKIPKRKINGRPVPRDGYSVTRLVENPFFCVEKYEIKTVMRSRTDVRRFSVYTCVGGRAKILSPGNEPAALDFGVSIFMPAALDEYNIEGECELLFSYAP